MRKRKDMFKFKYNILVSIQIILGLINSALLLRVFGVSVQSDVYLLANSIIGSLSGIQNLLIVQFIHFYNDEKVVSKESAHNFYNAALFFSFGIGIISFIIYHLFINQIINIFALNIDISRFLLVKNILLYSTLVLIFYPIMSINEAILNAEMKFSIPYIFAFIPTACIVATQILLMINSSTNIVRLAQAQAVGTMCVGIIGTIYITRTLIPFKLQFWHKCMPKFIRNSVEIAGGHAFYGIFFNIILNNFLASFPKGIISCYYYAKKVIDICTSFSVGPSKNILRSNISKGLANLQLNKTAIFIRKYLKLTVLIVGIVYAGAYLLIKPIIHILSSSITDNEIKVIKYLFLGLIPWSFLEIIGVPFAQFNIAAKKSLYLYIANVGFLLTLFISLYFLANILGIYAIIPATFLAAISCNAAHFILFLNLFNKKKKEICNG